MAQSLLELIFKTSKQGQGGKQAAAELKNLKGAIGEITSGLGLFNVGSLTAAGAIAGAAAFAASAVKDWSAYAEQVGKSADAAGVSAEEMSRLMQAADDARVPIESLERAMTIANKNGFQPTIENFANLADEIKGMASPTERAAKLSKIFGKSWQDIYGFLKDGGDAIREGTAAIADGLVVTEEAVEENREYIANLDNLNDSWTSFKNNLARDVIPVLNDVLTAINDQAAAAAKADQVIGMSRQERIAYIEAEKERIRTEREMEEALKWGEEAQEQFNAAMDVGAGAAAAFGQGVSGAAAAVSQQLGPSLDMVKESFKDLTLEMIYNKAAADLDAQAALALGREMGLVNEMTLGTLTILSELKEKYDADKDGMISAAEAAAGYTREVLALTGALRDLDGTQVNVGINISGLDAYQQLQADKGASPKGLTPKDDEGEIGLANAGRFVVPPGFPNDSYKIGLSSGEQVTVENERTRAMGGGKEVTVRIEQVNIYNDMDYRSFVERLKGDLKRAGFATA